MTMADYRGEAERAVNERRWLESTVYSTSLVIPTLNEAENLPWVLERIPRFVDEIILVDGRSTDRTVEIAREMVPNVIVVNEDRRGKGAALRAGFAAASGDVVVMIDADGSMDPCEIQRYVALLHAGFDLVKGSRFMAGGGSSDITWFRSFGNRSLLRLVNGLYRANYTDLCYGFLAFRRECLEGLALEADGFEIETEIVVRSARTRLHVCEVPSFESPRRSGTSNLRSVRDGFRVLRTLLVKRFEPAESLRGIDAPLDLDDEAVVIDLTDSAVAELKSAG